MIYIHFSESLFMAKSALEICTTLRCSWGLFADIFISLVPIFAIWFINQSVESVISIYNHYWWSIVPKTCNIPVESRKQVKLAFIFSRLILKAVYSQIVSTLTGLCLISITTYIQILKLLFEQPLDIVSNLEIIFQYLN